MVPGVSHGFGHSILKDVARFAATRNARSCCKESYDLVNLFHLIDDGNLAQLGGVLKDIFVGRRCGSHLSTFVQGSLASDVQAAS